MAKKWYNLLLFYDFSFCLVYGYIIIREKKKADVRRLETGRLLSEQQWKIYTSFDGMAYSLSSYLFEYIDRVLRSPVLKMKPG